MKHGHPSPIKKNALTTGYTHDIIENATHKHNIIFWKRDLIHGMPCKKVLVNDRLNR